MTGPTEAGQVVLSCAAVIGTASKIVAYLASGDGDLRDVSAGHVAQLRTLADDLHAEVAQLARVVDAHNTAVADRFATAETFSLAGYRYPENPGGER